MLRLVEWARHHCCDGTPTQTYALSVADVAVHRPDPAVYDLGRIEAGVRADEQFATPLEPVGSPLHESVRELYGYPVPPQPTSSPSPTSASAAAASSSAATPAAAAGDDVAAGASTALLR